MPIVGARCKASADKGRVEQVTCPIAGKRSSRSVGAAQAGSQPDDQNLGIQVAKRIHRRVLPIRLLLTPAMPESDQARAKRAIAGRCCRNRHHEPRSPGRDIRYRSGLVAVITVVVMIAVVTDIGGSGAFLFMPVAARRRAFTGVALDFLCKISEFQEEIRLTA